MEAVVTRLTSAKKTNSNFFLWDVGSFLVEGKKLLVQGLMRSGYLYLFDVFIATACCFLIWDCLCGACYPFYFFYQSFAE